MGKKTKKLNSKKRRQNKTNLLNSNNEPPSNPPSIPTLPPQPSQSSTTLNSQLADDLTQVDDDDYILQSPQDEEFSHFYLQANHQQLALEQQQQLQQQLQQQQLTSKEHNAPHSPSSFHSTDPHQNALSRRQAKTELKRTRLSVLKRLVPQPWLVEEHDANAPHPLFLMHLKALPASVAVPGHWLLKKGFHRRQRGPDAAGYGYELPAHIAATGIAEMREALRAKEDEKGARKQARERVRPKMSKLELDYNALYDSFHVFQQKPPLSLHGDVFFEAKHRPQILAGKGASPHFVPGVMSEQLRRALGMQSPRAPPPFLFQMQRFGPPPAYPALDIPGLNAPLPEGASYGFGPGQWGRPPTDAQGRALYARSVLATGAAESAESAVVRALAEAPRYRFGGGGGGESGSDSDSEEESEGESDDEEEEDSDSESDGEGGREEGKEEQSEALNVSLSSSSSSSNLTSSSNSISSSSNSSSNSISSSSNLTSSNSISSSSNSISSSSNSTHVISSSNVPTAVTNQSAKRLEPPKRDEKVEISKKKQKTFKF